MSQYDMEAMMAAKAREDACSQNGTPTSNDPVYMRYFNETAAYANNKPSSEPQSGYDYEGTMAQRARANAWSGGNPESSDPVYMRYYQQEKVAYDNFKAYNNPPVKDSQ